MVNIEKPFGPTLGEFKIDNTLVDTINSYTDDIINDKEKIKKQDAGFKLAGQVKQEFDIDSNFFNKYIKNKLNEEISEYVFKCYEKKFDTFENLKKKISILYHGCWIVRQFENEYNPLHLHTGSISGVCYILLPKSFGEKSQDNKIKNPNGHIALVHGTEQFGSQAVKLIKPEIGKFILFPNYMLHTVYPFKGPGERRSFSFNATINFKS